MQAIPQIGATGSRLLTGNSPFVEQLEQEIAHYHGEEAGLIYSSGYAANLGLISALADRTDTILYDEKVHASIRDGIILSRARHFAFRHNDVNHLKKLMKKCTQKPYVIVESIYSTDGSYAPLEAISFLCGERLIVDEAHATGVFGPGLVTTPILARVHTFSKALGAHGAIVLGSEKLKSYLVTTSRPLIYSTALSMPQLIAIQCAYEMLKKSPPFPFKHPIVAFRTANAKALAAASQKFDVRALLYPTVARGEECLRLCFHSHNTQQEVDELYAWLDRHRD